MQAEHLVSRIPNHTFSCRILIHFLNIHFDTLTILISLLSVGNSHIFYDTRRMNSIYIYFLIPMRVLLVCTFGTGTLDFAQNLVRALARAYHEDDMPTFSDILLQYSKKRMGRHDVQHDQYMEKKSKRIALYTSLMYTITSNKQGMRHVYTCKLGTSNYCQYLKNWKEDLFEEKVLVSQDKSSYQGAGLYFITPILLDFLQHRGIQLLENQVPGGDHKAMMLSLVGSLEWIQFGLLSSNQRLYHGRIPS